MQTKCKWIVVIGFIIFETMIGSLRMPELQFTTEYNVTHDLCNWIWDMLIRGRVGDRALKWILPVSNRAFSS